MIAGCRQAIHQRGCLSLGKLQVSAKPVKVRQRQFFGQNTVQVSQIEVQTLIEQKQPIDISKLGGGKWIVQYYQGPLAAWRIFDRVGDLIGEATEASQEFVPEQLQAINRVSIFGGKVELSAEGSYKELGSSTSPPKTILVSITKGKIRLFSKEIALPISGDDQFDILYLDDQIRVFESQAGVIVAQIKQQE